MFNIVTYIVSFIKKKKKQLNTHVALVKILNCIIYTQLESNILILMNLVKNTLLYLSLINLIVESKLGLKLSSINKITNINKFFS